MLVDAASLVSLWTSGAVSLHPCVLGYCQFAKGNG